MSGQQEIEPRWKRCVKATDATWAWRSASSTSTSTFGAEGKERTLKMVNAIEKAMQQDIAS